MGNLTSNLTLVIFALTTIPFVVVALFLARWSMKQKARVNASQNWPSTTGRILFSSVEQRRTSNARGGYSTSYYPVVRYDYTVNGQQYQGGTINFGQVGLGSYNAVAQKAAQYPVGSMVQVYYNPENPADAVLDRAAPSSRILGCVVIFIIVMLAGTGLFMLALTTFLNGVFENFGL